jgi:hypothetical protein
MSLHSPSPRVRWLEWLGDLCVTAGNNDGSLPSEERTKALELEGSNTRNHYGLFLKMYVVLRHEIIREVNHMTWPSLQQRVHFQ